MVQTRNARPVLRFPMKNAIHPNLAKALPPGLSTSSLSLLRSLTPSRNPLEGVRPTRPEGSTADAHTVAHVVDRRNRVHANTTLWSRTVRRTGLSQNLASLFRSLRLPIDLTCTSTTLALGSNQWIVSPRLNVHMLPILVLVQNDPHPFCHKTLRDLLDRRLRLDRLCVEQNDLAELRGFERFSANVQSYQNREQLALNLVVGQGSILIRRLQHPADAFQDVHVGVNYLRLDSVAIQ